MIDRLDGASVNVVLVAVQVAIILFLIFAWYSPVICGYVAAMFTARAAGLSSMRKIQTQTKLKEQARFGLIPPSPTLPSAKKPVKHFSRKKK